MDKQTVVQTYNEMLTIKKNEKNTNTCYNIFFGIKPLKHYANCKRLETKDQTLCVIPSMWNIQKRQVCEGRIGLLGIAWG